MMSGATREQAIEIIDCSVLIIGYGPVGKLLAILLGQAGITVVVADRREQGYPLPRAVTYDSEFARVMQLIGLAPSAVPDIVEPYDDLYRWTNAEGQTLLEVDWSGFGPSGWHNTYFFHQPALEERMDALIEVLPTVRVLRGWEAVGCAPVGDHVVAHLERSAELDPAADGLHSGRICADARASYLIGADGANSVVRDWIGSQWHDCGYFYDWLVVDVVPGPSLSFPHVAAQSCDPSRPSTMVPGGPGRRRWEFMRLPGEPVDDLDQTATAWSLLEPFGVRPDNAKLERHSVYTFQAGWANRWRNGRLLIAGDAAHLMPPFAGQGLGAGVRDAVNLAWKLAAVLSGNAAENVLDTYQAERAPHVASFIEFSMSLGRVICITDPVEASLRDARLMRDWAETRTAPTPPRPRLGASDLVAGDHGGELSMQANLEPGGPLLDDELGGPGALLVRDAGLAAQLSITDRRDLLALGVRVRTLAGDPSVANGPGSDRYLRWLDDLDADVALVRPDFYLYGTARADAIRPLVDNFVSAMCGRSSPSRESRHPGQLRAPNLS